MSHDRWIGVVPPPADHLLVKGPRVVRHNPGKERDDGEDREPRRRASVREAARWRTTERRLAGGERTEMRQERTQHERQLLPKAPFTARPQRYRPRPRPVQQRPRD